VLSRLILVEYNLSDFHRFSDHHVWSFYLGNPQYSLAVNGECQTSMNQPGTTIGPIAAWAFTTS
jgi:predicted cupin superfamily sugar epimerase